MPLRKIRVCLYSDNNETASVVSILNGIDGRDIELKLCDSSEIIPDEQDITIYNVCRLDSHLLACPEKLKERSNSRSVIFTVSGKDPQLVSTIAKLGFNDIFVFPYELYKFRLFIEELLKKHSAKTPAESTNPQASGDVSSGFIGNCEELPHVFSLAQKAADNPAINVLILGETGTGKSLLAKLIHKISRNNSGPFVEVICTAIPENLLESELFGYEKGAFTDAKSRKSGLFELAEGGTIFLDEIGDLSLGLQAKLLHVTENKVIRRLGGIRDIPVNTRIITATNRDLQKQLESNQFRRDLYYRLNAITFELPPLRKRGNDIMLLAEHFFNEFCGVYNKNITCITPEAWDKILKYSWPGNVRELRNSIERAVLLCDSPVLDANGFKELRLAEEMDLGINEDDHFWAEADDIIRLRLDFNQMNLSDLNRLYAKEVLAKLAGNKSKTSRVLGVSRPTLDNLLNDK